MFHDALNSDFLPAFFQGIYPRPTFCVLTIIDVWVFWGEGGREQSERKGGGGGGTQQAMLIQIDTCNMFMSVLLPCAAATATLCVQFRSYRSPNDTKARRARDLRPRRNYILTEDVEHHRRTVLQAKPELEDISARGQEATVEAPRDFRYEI